MFLQACVKNSVHKGVSAWADTTRADTLPPRRPLQRMERILLECSLVVNGLRR